MKTKEMYDIEYRFYVKESEWYIENNDMIFARVKELKARKILEEMVGVKNGSNKEGTLC